VIREAFIDIFKARWLSIFIALVITAIVRIIWLKIRKEKPIFYKEIFYGIFVIYIVCLFYVVTFQDVEWSSYNIVPFKEIFRYQLGSNPFIKNVIGNMIMFLPFGFFAGYILKLKKGRWALLLSVVTSLTIETIQYKIGRVFDVDDILLNVIGGMLGYYLYYSLDIIQRKLPKYINKNIICNIVVCIVVLLFIIYLGGFYE